MRFLPCAGGLLLSLSLALAQPASLRAQETRVVSGVVVDATTAAPVADVLVTIPSTSLGAVTDPSGRFRIEDVPTGELQLSVRHVAYGEHAQPLPVGVSGALEYRIKISSRAIELLPVVVEVESDEERARRSSGTVTNVIDRAAIAAFPMRGPGLLQLLGARVPSLRVVGGCVEYRVMMYTPPTPDPDTGILTNIECRDVTVYVDGIPIQDGSSALMGIPPEDVERIEVLSPADAGARYPNSSRGVILVETRRGTGPTNPVRQINITGFAWDEPEPYRWLRVLGLATVGNAVVVGLASKAILDCPPNERFPTLRCREGMGTGMGVATAGLGGLIARNAGRTEQSKGRTVPSLLIGSAVASVGYVLRLHGDKNDSSAQRAAGTVVLVVGMPLSLTLADRVFRVLR